MLGNVFLFQPYNDVIWLRRSRDVRIVRPFKANFQVHAHVCLSGRTGRASLLPVKRLLVFVEQLL